MIAEVADAREEQELATAAGADITWLHRGDAAAGTTRTLAGAVREVQPRDGDFCTWMAGEASSIQDVRRYLRDELGIPPTGSTPKPIGSAVPRTPDPMHPTRSTRRLARLPARRIRSVAQVAQRRLMRGRPSHPIVVHIPFTPGRGACP